MKKYLALIVTVFFGVVLSRDVICAEEAVSDVHVYSVTRDIDLIAMTDQVTSAPKTYIHLIYPQLASSRDNAAVDHFNQAVLDLLTTEREQFTAEVLSKNSPRKGEGRSRQRSDLYIDFDASFVQPHHHRIMSVRFSFQGIVTGSPHPYHYHRVFNYDLDRDEPITLHDLLRSEVQQSFIVEWLRHELTMRFNEQPAVVESLLQGDATNYQWNILPEGLLMTLDDRNAATPYGSQEILLPYNQLQNLLNPMSWLAVCGLQPKQCKHHVLLTGGFVT